MADVTESTEGQGQPAEASLSNQLRAARAQREQGSPASTTESEGSPSTATETAAAPPWGDDFEPERAWNTIQAQRESERAKDAEIARLRALETQRERDKMSADERVQAERDEAVARANQFETELLRRDVAAAKGLPASAIRLLNGCKDKREMEETADELLKLIGNAPETPARRPDFGNGARPPAGNDSEDFSSVLRRAAGRPA